MYISMEDDLILRHLAHSLISNKMKNLEIMEIEKRSKKRKRISLHLFLLPNNVLSGHYYNFFSFIQSPDLNT